MNRAAIQVSEAMQGILAGIDQVITEVAGERIGFLLLIFTDERASYGSNIDRQVAIREMKKLIALWEAGMPDIPTHEFNG